jgi:hypothetical protein
MSGKIIITAIVFFCLGILSSVTYSYVRISNTKYKIYYALYRKTEISHIVWDWRKHSLDIQKI